MGSAKNWTQPQDFPSWMRHIEKRVGHEERRPAIRSSAALMGPILGPVAHQTLDWNGEETMFNGFVYGPAGALNSPDTTREWFGLSIMNTDGHGIQRAWAGSFGAVVTSLEEWERVYTNGLWGPWVALREGWRAVGATGQPGFLNGWSNAGGTAAVVAFRREGDVVRLKGRATGGNTALPLFTLPAGYRPSEDTIVAAVVQSRTDTSGPASAGTAHTHDVTMVSYTTRLNIRTSGDVDLGASQVSNTFVSLSGITFVTSA